MGGEAGERNGSKDSNLFEFGGREQTCQASAFQQLLYILQTRASLQIRVRQKKKYRGSTGFFDRPLYIAPPV